MTLHGVESGLRRAAAGRPQAGDSQVKINAEKWLARFPRYRAPFTPNVAPQEGGAAAILTHVLRIANRCAHGDDVPPPFLSVLHKQIAEMPAQVRDQALRSSATDMYFNPQHPICAAVWAQAPDWAAWLREHGFGNWPLPERKAGRSYVIFQHPDVPENVWRALVEQAQEGAAPPLTR